MVTIWSRLASNQLQKSYNYIKRSSLQNAEKVRDEIIDKTIALAHNPEIHPLDKYKTLNDGSYRAFELHRYRVTYRVLKESIRIVRLRHTSQSPLQF
jgi:plasmid stabilization system protein ParE